MKLTAQRKQLTEALTYVAQALNNRPNIPALASIKLDADGDTLTLTATDYDRWHRAAIDAQGDPGQALAPGQLLRDLVAGLKADEVTLAADNGRLHLTAGRSRYQLAAAPVEDYPTPLDPGPEVATVDAEALRHACEAAAAAASTEQAQPGLLGANLQHADRTLTVAASDRYRLVATHLHTGADGEWRALPNARELAAVTKHLDGQVTIRRTDNTITVDDGQHTATLRLIDREWVPNWQRLVPASSRHILVDVAELDEAIDRAKLVVEKNSPLRIDIDGDQIRLSPNSGDHQGSEELEALSADLDQTFVAGYQPGYLLTALVTQRTERAHLDLPDDPNKPLAIRPIEPDADQAGDHHLHIVMPIRFDRS